MGVVRLARGRTEILTEVDEHLTRVLASLRKQSSAAFGLTGTQYFLLRTLVEQAGCTASDLAERLGVTPSSVTGLTDRLLKGELVTRVRDQGDRRIVRIRATARGEAVLQAISARRQELAAALFAGLSDSELAELSRLLGGIG